MLSTPTINGSGTATLTISTLAGIAPGTYRSPSRAAAGGTLTTFTSRWWYKGGQSFTITSTPARQTVAPGATGQYTVQVTGTGGLTSGNVVLTAANAVGGVSFNGASSATVPIGGSVTMAVAVSPNAPNGAYPVKMTGMLGGVPVHVAPGLDVAFPGEALAVSSVDGDQEDSAGFMVAGVPQLVTISGSGFGNGNAEEDDGYIEFSGNFSCPLTALDCPPPARVLGRHKHHLDLSHDFLVVGMVHRDGLATRRGRASGGHLLGRSSRSAVVHAVNPSEL